MGALGTWCVEHRQSKTGNELKDQERHEEVAQGLPPTDPRGHWLVEILSYEPIPTQSQIQPIAQTWPVQAEFFFWRFQDSRQVDRNLGGCGSRLFVVLEALWHRYASL
jgi:hypothetical protein